MAVDIKTLRIGSHVQHHGKRKMVHSMGGDTVYLLPSIVSSVAHVAKTDEIEPIPITPELLTELGFQYRDNTYWEHWFLGSFDIERKEGSLYFDYNSEIRLEYLHELEDLYYLIYGAELIKE